MDYTYSSVSWRNYNERKPKLHYFDFCGLVGQQVVLTTFLDMSQYVVDLLYSCTIHAVQQMHNKSEYSKWSSDLTNGTKRSYFNQKLGILNAADHSVQAFGRLPR